MKKMLAVMGLLAASSALAQTWDGADGKLTLVGCYGKQDGVYCDFSYTLTKKQTAALSWRVEWFKVFKQDGTSQLADGVAFIDGKIASWESDRKEIIANVPVKVQAYFNVPSSISGFRALSYGDVKFDNIPVKPFGSVSKTPIPIPDGPSVSGFSIALSNCQLQGLNYVCTAILTPTK